MINIILRVREKGLLGITQDELEELLFFAERAATLAYAADEAAYEADVYSLHEEPPSFYVRKASALASDAADATKGALEKLKSAEGVDPDCIEALTEANNAVHNLSKILTSRSLELSMRIYEERVDDLEDLLTSIHDRVFNILENLDEDSEIRTYGEKMHAIVKSVGHLPKH